MIAELTIYTPLPLVFSTGDRLASLGTLRRPLSGNGTSAENANMSIALDNGDALLTATFALPPLRVKAEISVDAEVIFSGVVSSVDLSEQITIEVQA